jgi:RNase adaptor protein for sRNA GlmZ degradation
MLNEIEVEVKINQTANVMIDIALVIDAINNLELKHRWNYVAQILSKLQLNLSELDSSQKIIIRRFLENRLELFAEEV